MGTGDAITPLEKETMMASYRDAYFKVRDLDREELEEVLEHAERVGDERLGLAAYHVCVTKGYVMLADQWRASRPKHRERWERYKALRTDREDVGSMLLRGLEERF